MVDKDFMDDAIVENSDELQLQNDSTHFTDDLFKLFAKIEGMNPGGSIKDRSGLHTLEKYFD